MNNINRLAMVYLCHFVSGYLTAVAALTVAGRNFDSYVVALIMFPIVDFTYMIAGLFGFHDLLGAIFAVIIYVSSAFYISTENKSFLILIVISTAIQYRTFDRVIQILMGV